MLPRCLVQLPYEDISPDSPHKNRITIPRTRTEIFFKKKWRNPPLPPILLVTPQPIRYYLPQRTSPRTFLLNSLTDCCISLTTSESLPQYLITKTPKVSSPASFPASSSPVLSHLAVSLASSPSNLPLL